jgi:stage II sporulation SpoE-like protein
VRESRRRSPAAEKLTLRTRSLLVWLLLGMAGASLLVWAHNRVFRYVPDPWTLSKTDAETIALERFRQLGKPVDNAYVVTKLDVEELIEARLVEARLDRARIAGSPLLDQTLYWQVRVYPPGARPQEFTYRAEISADGDLMALRRRLPPQEAVAGRIDAATARQRADAFLVGEGYPLDRFAPSEVRTQELQARVDTTVRYPYREQVLGNGIAYGMQVLFAGDQLLGFEFYFDDPNRAQVEAGLQPIIMLENLRFVVLFSLVLVVAIPFLRRYHEGEVGVRRGLQIMAVTFAAGILLIVLSARPATEGINFGVFSRVQVTWVWSLQLILIFFMPLAVVAGLAWSVGESFSRERWGAKLAAFDALISGRFQNATVARSALRGTAGGLLLAGGVFALGTLFDSAGLQAIFAFNFGPWWTSATWPGLAMLGFCLAFSLYAELFGRLFVISWLSRRMDPRLAGAIASLVTGLLLWGSAPLSADSVFWTMTLAVASAGALVALFLQYDLLTAILASLVSGVVTSALPLVQSENSWLQFQGGLALLGAALPLILSLRHLFEGEEFIYRYDDIPPHVRRIAERERQRVELETARGIQSSILPELPPRLQGIDLAHAYLPANEVGGDFYDVLALEDGRLAVAVGDVAGHGVSSGLVMSMAKSALAVQVTFDPEVPAVFKTLNRMVHQTARKRMLATLCYALIDPVRREMHYASAGHLFPYRITRAGRVEALESVSYPLGVRPQIEVHDHLARLESGEYLVLFSDGIIEARRDGSDELFGFERFERSLAAHAGGGVGQLRDGVLADLAAFTGDALREDDLTLLVLRLPTAA